MKNVKIDEIDILGTYRTEEVAKLEKETFDVEAPTLELALRFLSEAPKLNIDDYEKKLFLEKPEYFDLNKVHKFSKITPYSLLYLSQNSYWGLTQSFQYDEETISKIFYNYLKNKGYTDKTILKVNPNYLRIIENAPLDLFYFSLKVLLTKGAQNHHLKISMIDQKPNHFPTLYSIQNDLKLLENKIKILKAVG